MLYDTEITLSYHDAYTNAVTEITFRRTGVEAPDRDGAVTSALGIVRSTDLAELLDEPDARLVTTAVPGSSGRPDGMLLLSAAIIPGRRTTMHDHPIAGRQSAGHLVSTHHGHSGGHIPHAHPDGDWREQWYPGGGGTRHVHEYHGQVLTHDHEGGGVPHDYYGHPEDPADTNRRTRS